MSRMIEQYETRIETHNIFEELRSRSPPIHDKQTTQNGGNSSGGLGGSFKRDSRKNLPGSGNIGTSGTSTGGIGNMLSSKLARSAILDKVRNAGNKIS